MNPLTITDTQRARTATRPLNVVMVDEELPYPPISGKRIRTYNLTRRLADRHRLTYVCHRNADPVEARRAADHFADLGINTVIVDRPVPPRSGPGFYWRLATNLFSPLPYSVATHTSRPLRQALEDLAANEPIDLWHVEWTPYAQVLRGLTGRRVVMAHNVESTIWQRYHETARNPLKKWYIARQWRKFQRFETQVLKEAECTIAVSDLDAERFRNDMRVRSVEVVDNGVDPAYFAPQPVSREKATLLFLGSLDWRPNLDGVQQLLDTVFPSVRAVLPEARLWIVGRNPPEALTRRCAATEGVQLHANVPDVRSFLARCTLMVVPLRIGGGSRLKILESLAMQTPVVSTRIGAEGLHLESGRHLVLAEDVDELSVATIGALNNPQSGREQAIAGQRQVLRLYDWDALADRLETIWRQTVQQG